MNARIRGQSGQASIEFVGSLVLILFAALAMWQLLIVMWATNETSNAARTAARVQSRGGDTKKAARNALPRVLRHELKVDPAGETVTLTVRIPLLFPGFDVDAVHATREATIPR
jgi:Flp pilus assembly protein TadG